MIINKETTRLKRKIDKTYQIKQRSKDERKNNYGE